MFDLRFVATSSATTTFETLLDAYVPYLDDHRPGNDPLFGTTMGIALMTQACSASFRASVVVDTRGHSDYRPKVASPDVYGLFFHGPAFQVVHSAALNDGEMWCEIAPTVASFWERGARGEPVAAQQIELCLLTAGLLEVATTERMMIPKRISCIDRGTGNPSAARIARARRSGEHSFDIELWDDAQNNWCVVWSATKRSRFRSHPMPLLCVNWRRCSTPFDQARSTVYS